MFGKSDLLNFAQENMLILVGVIVAYLHISEIEDRLFVKCYQSRTAQDRITDVTVIILGVICLFLMTGWLWYELACLVLLVSIARLVTGEIFTQKDGK